MQKNVTSRLGFGELITEVATLWQAREISQKLTGKSRL